ncbi:hypothetical protein CL619_03865 [archaeon]|nr:hypothetical protein [archaeon]|tara:strand:+ start:4735 stop:5067 length:333 start_codon:yes stop_codon:yes gene_type:complete
MIKNKTTNQLITTKVIRAKSFWRQGLGLMFHKRNNLIMHFKQTKTISLHNFFVFYPLEIIILNKYREVIEINPAFKPFTFYTAKNKGSYCIELGTIDATNKVSIGDVLEF